MRILLAAKYVSTGRVAIGGVQSWCKTVRAELERRGHKVVEWEPGMMDPKGAFDLGIFANVALTWGKSWRCKRTIAVCHGIIPAEEPSYVADKVFFVSEGVRNHWLDRGWRTRGNEDAGVIRQPIDLEFWAPNGRARRYAIRYSYRRTQTHAPIAASMLGMDYKQVGNVTHAQALLDLRSARVVFATGRAALESMATGTPTVIYDHRSSYQGPLLDDDLQRQMENSYSGRGGVMPHTTDVARAAAAAMALPARHWREWVAKHHDARKIVGDLIA